MSDLAAPAQAMPALRIRSRVLFGLSIVALFGALRGGFLSVAPNRLAAGHAVVLSSGSPAATALIFGLIAALAALAFLAQTRPALIGALAGAALLLLATLGAAADLSAFLVQKAAPATRCSLGPAFWILALAASLAMIDGLQKLGAGILRVAAFALAMTAAIVAMALGGVFDSLSLAREFASHRTLFLAALDRHVELVAAALLIAILCGAPLAILVERHARARAPVFATLNMLQTIPSIALFGLLIGPLSYAAERAPWLGALGIGGIGAAPAILALVLYSLLPLVRNATAGLAGVDPAVIDSARGMGMSESEILRKIRLPLALPALVSALRIVTIQTIGLATVAALIGAGGLGTFVFQGIGQYALDLVLVGALPIVLLALAADLVFQIWLAALRWAP